MWSELFLENRDNLTAEINCLIGHLTEIRDAMQNEDRETLENLLEEGRRIKVELDG